MPTEHDEGGHVPAWPRYIERSWPSRVLAYYDAAENLIIDEEGNRYELGDDFHCFVALLWESNYLLFVGSLASFCFLPDIIAHPLHEVLCAKPPQAKPIAAKLRGRGNTTRWIVQADAWGLPASAALLQTLRATYEHCQVGTQSTPGGLGQALMRRSYKEEYGEEWWKHRHYRPALPVCNDILNHMTGGRVDTPGLGKFYEVLYEYDQKSAYAAHYFQHPAGTAVRIYKCESGVTYFAHCKVSIPPDISLLLGPFPVRVEENDHSRPEYPTEPGTYDAWLWREEIEDCRQLGLEVEVLEGWAWERWTEDNSPWVLLMEMLREAAPAPDIAENIKRATVSGIGRHGVSPVLYQLVGPEQAAEDDIPIAESISETEGLIYNWFVHQFHDPRYNAQVHWFAYTIMQCRRTLYWKALAMKQKEFEAGAEVLVATNYDAVYATYEDESVPLAGTDQARALRTGGWKRMQLHRVKIPKPRHIISDEKQRQPGKKKEKYQKGTQS